MVKGIQFGGGEVGLWELFRCRTPAHLLCRGATVTPEPVAIRQTRLGIRLRADAAGLLAGNPRRRPLVFSAIGDLAFLAARYELENNFFTAVQAGSSVILGGREDQPMSSQDFVGSVLGEDLITTVRIHLQRRCRAMVGFARNFHTYALVSSG
jgi:hypothetical protein